MQGEKQARPVFRPVRSPVRLSKQVRFAIYVVGVGTWITGILWLLLDRFVLVNGPFGPEKSPLEPWSLKLHGAVAMGAVFLLGFLWAIHIQTAWPMNRRRLSGGVLTGVFLFLLVTGYLLYYVADEQARSVVSIAHWGSGLVFPSLYWVHRFKRKRARSTTERD